MKCSAVSWSLLAFVLLIASCTSSFRSDPAPSMAMVGVRMLATSQEAGSITGRSSGLILSRKPLSLGLSSRDSMTFQQILLGVSKLEFDPLDTTKRDSSYCHMDGEGHSDGRHGNGEDDDDEDGDDDAKDSTKLKFEGAFIVDLLEGTSTPDFGTSKVVPGDFRKIKIKLSRILPDSNSIQVKGTVFVKDTSYQVEFTSRMRMTIVLIDRHGIQLNNSMNDVLVELDLRRFFERINFEHAEADEDGVIRITASFNRSMFDELHRRILESIRIGKDSDRNGHIDD